MNKKRTSSVMAALFVFATVFSIALAERRPHEGKILKIDQDAKSMTVQGENNDQWTLYWTETTKWKNLTVPELTVGDSIHFDYVEKDGQMFVTELRRTHKAS